MSSISDRWSDLWGRLSRRELREQVDEELEFHLAMKTEELVASGMTPEAAQAEAVERLGDAGWIREECGTIRREFDRRREHREWFHTLRRDVRYALRRIARQPVFAALAVLVRTGFGISPWGYCH